MAETPEDSHYNKTCIPTTEEESKVKNDDEAGFFYWFDCNDSNGDEIKRKPKLKERRKPNKLTAEEIQEKLDTANKRREVSRNFQRIAYLSQFHISKVYLLLY